MELLRAFARHQGATGMPDLPADPNGRPSSAKREPGTGDSPLPSGEDAGSGKASTHSHHPTPKNPLADILQSTGSARRQSGSDILQALTEPGPALVPGAPLGALENTDDAPTVITNQLKAANPSPLPPTPLYVTGDPPSVAGRRLGNYELIEAVGAGGMAAVLKARDLELGRIVALKILPPEAARDPESVNRFKQEARAAARLDHENVARVYACGEDQGLHFIAFEFVEGINLRQMIERRGTIPPGECIRYMIQIAAGLNHAAERGVVHRDIKPSNIVITPDGRAKIVDMGLARQLEGGSVNGDLTHSGVTLGTFDYISPEQALDPRRADVRSDIYSLGCAFYHALTGRPPVPEGNATKKLHAHQNIEPLDPRQINPNIPDELVAVLARMMAKSPDKRYQTPTELIAHLKGLAERFKLSPDLFGQDSVVKAVQAELSALPQAPRLRLGWVLGVAAVVVAVAAFAMSTGDPGLRTTPPPWAGEQTNAKGEPITRPNNGGSQQPIPVSDNGVVHTVEELAAKLAAANPDGPTTIQLAGGVVFDLTKLTTPLVFQGKELILNGSVSPPTVLKVNYGPLSAGTGTPPAGSLSVVGAEAVSVSGVRFVAVRGADQVPAFCAGLTLADVPQITLTDCSFSGEFGRGFLPGSVRVARGGARVRVERCAFGPAGFGLWVPDRSEVTVSDCGFGPHSAAIQIGDGLTSSPETAPQDVKLTLERSSFLLDPDSAVVWVPAADRDDTGVRVYAGHCVFAAVPGAGAMPVPLFPGTTPLRRAVVIRAQSHADEVHFAGLEKQKNAYYSVVPLSVPENGGTKYYTFEQCKADELSIADVGAVTLTRRPWAEADPLRVLGSGDRGDPWRAFRLNLSDPAVFTPDTAVKVIGAQFDNPGGPLPWRAYPELVGGFPPPPRSPAVPEKRVLVWYPESKEDPLPKDTYTDLAALLRKAQSGDEILIRHDGLVPVERVEVKPRAGADAATFRVTFKPYPGSKPILTVPGGRDLNQTLFLDHTGSARFEGLQFLLKPTRSKDPQRVAGVQLVGAESCSFTDCVFTLAEEDDAKATVAAHRRPRQGDGDGRRHAAHAEAEVRSVRDPRQGPRRVGAGEPAGRGGFVANAHRDRRPGLPRRTGGQTVWVAFGAEVEPRDRVPGRPTHRVARRESWRDADKRAGAAES